MTVAIVFKRCAKILQSFRAPAIYGYAGNKIGKTYYDSIDSQDAVNTVWSITTPFDTCLSH